MQALRSRAKPSHFLSIPMTSNTIVQNFEKFKEEILTETTSPAMVTNTFIPAEKLHITLGVMSLMDDGDQQRAISLLAEAKEKVIDNFLKKSGPITIDMKGVSYMNNNPHAMHVLYGKVVGHSSQGDVLQQFVDQIQDYFVKFGFMERERDHVNLHVTLLNTRYKQRAEHTRRREPFDGSKILSKYADFNFGAQQLNQIHLSQMGSSGGIDGFYNALTVISV